MTLFEKFVYVFVSVVALWGLYFGFTDSVFFEEVYTKEDGWVEWISAFGFFVGFLIFSSRVWRLRQVKPRIFLVMTSLAALVFLFGAGEEISWGQRVFGLETPEALKKINSQGEINLHNIQIGDFKVNKVIFSQLLGLGLVFYLLILPWLYARILSAKHWADRLAIPIPHYRQVLFYLVIIILISLIPNQRKWELMEFSGSLVFLMIALFAKNKKIYEKS